MAHGASKGGASVSRDGADARTAAAAAAAARRAARSAGEYVARRGMTAEERAERRAGLLAEHAAPPGVRAPPDADAGAVAGLRPVGGLEWMAENAIAQAIRRGALDDLPNKGKPLQVRPEESVPWAFDPTEAALMRTIKSQGFTLESIACRDELDRLRSEVVGASRSALRGAGGAAAARAAASVRLDELIAATRALNAAVAREQLASRALHYPVAQRPLPTLEELLAEAGVAKGGR